MTDKPHMLSQGEIEKIVERAVDRAIERKLDQVTRATNQALTRMGLDPDSPIEVQKDMSWLRTRRTIEGQVQGKVKITVITTIVTVITGALVTFAIRYLGIGTTPP